jgi:ATP-dependent protease HslVU (ClpYQ) peptidase subunit
VTVIVGLVEDGHVYIGADSAGVAGYNLSIRADAKVFRNGPFVMGFTSSFRMGQLLRWSFTPPEHKSGVSDAQFMATTFVDAIRECFRSGGYIKKDNERESGGTFIVGYNGRVWSVEDDFQVGEFEDGYAAVGCGASIAVGALYATEHLRARSRIRKALQAAERHSAGVRAPFRIVKTKGP